MIATEHGKFLCKNMHHSKLNSRYCSNCEAYAEVNNGRCVCCGFKINKRPKCQGKHENVHNHYADAMIAFCNYCKAHVIVTDNVCNCCGERVYLRKKNYRRLEKTLNAAMKNKRIRARVKDFTLFPTEYLGTMHVKIRFNNSEYSIPIKYVALWDANPQRDEVLPLIFAHTIAI